MCKWGTDKEVTLCVPRENGILIARVDSCIASIVQSLNDSGIKTVASCCGHNKRPGIISLDDERELIVVSDYKTTREIMNKFPDIWGG